MKRSLLGLLSVVLLCAGEATAQDKVSAADKQMAQKIASQLKTSGRLKGYSVEVRYKDGTAWLDGTVSSEEQLGTAGEVVEGLDGVSYVVNRLQIRGARGENPLRTVSREVSVLREPMPDRARTALAVQPAQNAAPMAMSGAPMGPRPIAHAPGGMPRRVSYDHASMPQHAWPSYAP